MTEQQAAAVYVCNYTGRMDGWVRQSEVEITDGTQTKLTSSKCGIYFRFALKSEVSRIHTVTESLLREPIREDERERAVALERASVTASRTFARTGRES